MNTIKYISGGIFALLTYLFGGFDLMLSILVSLIIIDYITGILSAICNEKLSSSVGYKGIFKKVGILIIIALAHLTGQSMGIEWVRSAIIGFYIANEGISILENIGNMGVPLPQKLLSLLTQLKEDNDGGIEK